MTDTNPSKELVAQAYREAAEIEKQWTPFHEGGPPKRGYYYVRDCEGRDGIAFMNLNRTWTLIDGALKKPLASWREIPNGRH